MRITGIIHSLDGGGAERLMSGLVNRLGSRHEVTLITLDDVSSDRYPLEPHVNRIALGLMQESGNLLTGLFRNLRRLTILRAAINDSSPNVILSFCDKTNILTLAALHGFAPFMHSHKPGNAPIVVSEHSDPRQQTLGLVWGRLRRIYYRSASAGIALTPQTAELIRLWIPGPIDVIPPAVELPELRTKQPNPTFRWVAVGRLSKEKGLDAAIRAFHLLRERQLANEKQAASEQALASELWIAGEGPCRAELEQLIQRLGLTASVRLLGWVSDVGSLLASADAFLMTSHYEGFPVGMLEAMAHGLPAVAFDCDSGPRQIIEDGKNGRLVADQDIDQLVIAMLQVMQSPKLRNEMGVKARQTATNFSWEKFVERHEQALQRSMAARKR